MFKKALLDNLLKDISQNTDIEVINLILEVLRKTDSASKGSIGKLVGDKAELVMVEITSGEQCESNNPGFDILGKAFLPELPKIRKLKYEIKVRRSSGSCNFGKSQLDKFDVGIVIWYDEKTLLPRSAFAIKHDVVKKHFKKERASITPKIFKKYGIDFTELVIQNW